MKRSLEITTMVGCPLMCTICPQDKLRSIYAERDKYLSLENFKLVIDKLPADVKIIFAGYSEAWANPAATDMLEYALIKNHTISVFTTLYGMADPERVVNLLTIHRSQVEQVWLHLPDQNNNMPGYKPSAEYSHSLDLFLEKIQPHIMTMHDQGHLHQSITQQIKPYKWMFNARAENVSRNEQTVKFVEEFNNEFIVECVRNKDLTDNVLMPNGDVTLCCNDYGMKHVLGNLFTQEYSEVIKAVDAIIEKNHVLFDRSTLCRRCHDTWHRTPWNDKEVYDLTAKEYPDTLGL